MEIGSDKNDLVFECWPIGLKLTSAFDVIPNKICNFWLIT